MADKLWQLTARQAVALLRRKEVSPLDLIDAAEARIAEVEPAINALPILCFERARVQAARMQQASSTDLARPGYLHGLPIVVKDLTAVAGVRWTEGSRAFAERVAVRSDVLVETLEANGAIVIAKSNTPEFGAGGNTVNDVFGHTRNPWNVAYTTGGSSGGSAAALATGEAWLATGTDMAGSIRLPASFCSVVGLRPGPGRVAHGRTSLPFSPLDLDGPMARNVGDVALMLDAMTGYCADDPMSLPAPAVPFIRTVEKPAPPRRIAWSPDLGIAPTDAEVRDICLKAVPSLQFPGTAIEEDCPDLGEAEETFQALRNMHRVAGTMDLIGEHRDKLSPEIVFYTERGLSLSARDIGRAELARSAIYARMVDFFARYDVLATPTVMVPPFDIGQRHVMEVNGVKLPDYFAWLRLTLAVSVTSCPAISVPCGFTAAGLPVGLQLIGRPRGEAALLSTAALFEAQHAYAAMVPLDPRLPGGTAPTA
jgi:amidase